MENKDNSIINSLKRLERAGGENSKTSEKLRDAAADVAQKICDIVGHTGAGTKASGGFPRGYSVAQIYYQESFHLALKIYDLNEWLNVRKNARRENILKFAEDIATGLLDEIAAWLEQRKQANEQATSKLENSNV